MKVIINTKNQKIIDGFNRSKFSGKSGEVDLVILQNEVDLLNSNLRSPGDGYLVDPSSDSYLKFISSIKRKNPYGSIIVFGPLEKISEISSSDLYLPISLDASQKEIDAFCKISLMMIYNYLKKIEPLKKLSEPVSSPIEFGECIYDPIKRILYHRGKDIKRMSLKEGGILEILASNLGKVVKKEIILERVWKKIDYFAGRSMDVYVTHLRNTIKANEIPFSIKNISGSGLLME